jgi:hypothetical protein
MRLERKRAVFGKTNWGASLASELSMRVTAKGEALIATRLGGKSMGKQKYPKRGEDCEYTEDCMWGVDGWCDRPADRKCVVEEMDAKTEAAEV